MNVIFVVPLGHFGALYSSGAQRLLPPLVTALRDTNWTRMQNNLDLKNVHQT